MSFKSFFCVLDSLGGKIRHSLSVSNISLANMYILYNHRNYFACFNSNEWCIYCLTHWGRHRVAAISRWHFRVHFLEWTWILNKKKKCTSISMGNAIIWKLTKEIVSYGLNQWLVVNHPLLSKSLFWHFALCSSPLSSARSIMVVTNHVLMH